jgi:putative nucleotidyltransferase with HDIG domain
MASVIAQPLDAALESARQRIARLTALPVLDPRLLAVLAEGDIEVQYQHLRELLRVDPALAARVLRVANSAFYGSRSISSIDRALTVLGAMAVAGIAMAARFDGGAKVVDGQFKLLRRHSLMTAVAARALAARAELAGWDPESAFVLGLLHDLGWLVQLQMERDRALRREDAQPFRTDDLAEHALFSAALLAHWQLPAQFIDAVRDHHHVAEFPASTGAALLAVAEQCAKYGGDAFGADRRPQDSQLPLALFHLTATELAELGTQCAAEAAVIDGLVN